MELAEEVTEEVTGGACGQARRHPAARPTPASWGGGEVAGGWGHVPLPGPVGGRWCRLWTWWRTSRPRACRPPALGWLPGLTSPIRLFQARRS
jgi:hypothetical protein